MSYIWQAATTTWHWICWCVATLFLALGLVLVSPALAVYLALDFIPKRESKPLTSPTPRLRKRPHLRSNGSDVFWEMPDGEIIPLDGLEASLVLKEVADVVGGAFCYEKTRLPES